MITIGQVWQDNNDLLFITDIIASGDRLIVKGDAIFNGVVSRYTCESARDFAFGRLAFDPTTRTAGQPHRA